jgi:glycosyltransferase involved in cell wall biosynthesis
MSSVSISVIVPCYNQGEFLNQCLESVHNQEFKNWECIIINDGSNDNSHEIAIKWTNIDTRFKLINISNSGPSFARNTGIGMANGKFILPLDADDYLSPNYILSCVDFLERNHEYKVAYGAVQNFGTCNDFQFNQSNFDYKLHLVSNQIHVSGVFYKKDSDFINGYDNSMRDGFEDWEFYIRLLNDQSKVFQLKLAVLYYRRKNISRNENLLRNQLNVFTTENYIYNKHVEKYSQFVTGAISSLRINIAFNSLETKLSYFNLAKIFRKKLTLTRRKYLKFKR